MQPSHAVRRPTILIVEDYDDFRCVLAEFLEAEGFDVLAAADGAEALRLLDTTPSLDFVLLDLVLPLTSGERILESLQSGRWKHVPVVAMTSYAKPEPKGVVAMLWKPFSLDTLLDLIAQNVSSGVAQKALGT